MISLMCLHKRRIRRSAFETQHAVVTQFKANEAACHDPHHTMRIHSHVLVARSFKSSSLIAAAERSDASSRRGSLWCSCDSFPLAGLSLWPLGAVDTRDMTCGPLMALITAVTSAALRCTGFHCKFMSISCKACIACLNILHPQHHVDVNQLAILCKCLDTSIKQQYCRKYRYRHGCRPGGAPADRP